jgi:hypothetical protein
MWMLRFLNGPQSGQTFYLKKGVNRIGRTAASDIQVQNQGVSKDHAVIEVKDNQVLIKDLKSTNGTFVNGLQVNISHLKPGDKISFQGTVIEFTGGQALAQTAPRGSAHMPPAHPAMNYQVNGAHALQMPPQQNFEPQLHAAANVQAEEPQKGMLGSAQEYIDDVVLPGVYKLASMMEFKWLIASFVLVFIVTVTLLSSIPLMRILKSSVEQESQRRALTIARNMAQSNRSALSEGIESAVNVNSAQREPGVEAAMIVSQVDGSIIAPANKAGQYPEQSFVHAARRLNRETVEQLSSDSIGAAVPIDFYNAQTGSQSTAAFAIVIYNMGTLAVNDSKTLSLFVQTFFISLIIGSILFFFLYKVIEYPYAQINKQVDLALKDGNDQLKVNYDFEPLQKLLSTISSLLSRAQAAPTIDANHEAGKNYDRFNEMNQLVQMIGFPCIAVSFQDRFIQSVNSTFEQITGLQQSDVVLRSINDLSDQALRLSLLDLVERLALAPNEPVHHPLEFSGVGYQIIGRAVWGDSSIAYMLFSIVPQGENG